MTKKILVDGAGGELFRRQFLNRLIIKGEKVLKDKNPSGILKYISLLRADIFNDEINSMLKEAALDQISLVIEKLPDPNNLNIEDYVDLFAAITRFPNYYGPEQNRLNSILLSYMPFVDEILFKSLIDIPVKVRKNNKMFYDYLLKNRNNLTKFMLVKGDLTYPFGLSTKSIYAYSTIREKISKLRRIKKNNNFYKNHKTMVLDILNSNDVRSSSFYSQKRIQDIIKNLHSDEMQSYGQLDWLISFVLFKKAFNLKS